MRLIVKCKGLRRLAAYILILLLLMMMNNTISYAKGTLHSNDLIGQKILLNNEGKIISGPWGKLEEVPMIIQPPTRLFENYQEEVNIINSGKHWIFKNTSLTEIQSLFLNAGLSRKICRELLSYTKAIPNGYGFITSPPDTVLENFTPEIKAKLYPVIGKYSDNITYYHPFHYNSPNAEEWFFNCSLNKDLVKRLSSLIYVQKNICYISDLHLIVPFIKTPAEWTTLLQTLFRTPALEVYLKVDRGEDVSKLVDYWKNFDRIQYVTSIFEKMRNSPGGGKINISNLLPTITRLRLNTFASIEESNTYNVDCHWTSFNFFNDQYDDRPILLNRICRPLSETEQPKFGDIYLISDENNRPHP